MVQKLSQELAQVMAMPEVKERLTNMGYEPRTEMREDFGAVIAHDFKRFGQVIREAGIKLD